MAMTKKNRTISPFPLSPMQHGMLMQTIKSPSGAGCYIEQIVFDINQTVDPAAFTTAWQTLVRHHEFMTIGFTWQGLDFPEQFTASVDDFKVEFYDLIEKSPAGQKAYLDLFLTADRRLGFALDKPPVFRAALFQTGRSAYTCVWSFHHSIADGRSMTAVLRDLFLVYNAPHTHLTPSGSFKSYIHWFTNNDKTATREYWKNRLKDFSEPIAIRFNGQSPRETGHHRQPYAITVTTASSTMHISRETTNTLKGVCRVNNVTMNSLLMGVWALVLSHYTGKTDIVFGTTRSIRNWQEGSKNDTGLYINTLPERIKVNPLDALPAFFKKIRQGWIEARSFEHISLTDIHAASDVTGTKPLFDIYFSYDHASLNQSMAPYKDQLSCSHITLFERTPAALFLSVKGEDELTTTMEYDRRLYTEPMIQQILGHFKNGLESVADNPNACLKQVSILSTREKESIFSHLNTLAPHDKPSDKCIHEVFEIQAALNNTMTALVDGNCSLSYDQLNRRANQMAHLLMGRGAEPESKAVILLNPGQTLITAILGVLKSGGCYIPLDISSPPDRINTIIADARPRFILTTDSCTKGLEPGDAELIAMDQIGETLATMPRENPKVPVTPENLAYIIYTSGSTGKPKGVMIKHSGLMAFTGAAANLYQFEPNDKVLQFASISFDTSAEEIFPTLFSGACLVIKPAGVVQTPDQFMAFCSKNGISVLDLPTSYWHILADHTATLTFPDSLRLVIIGGDEANPKKVKQWNRHVPGTIRLLNTYGPTETTVAVTWADLAAGSVVGTVPIGSPFPSVNLAILNHFDQPVPPRVTGELFIGGPQTARGYLNRSELTRNAFVPLACTGRETRFFKTRDRAEMLPSGQVVFKGRVDRQVKIRGFRIEPGEIEKTAENHPAVMSCAITVIKEKQLEGDGQLASLTAFILVNPAKKDNFSIADLKQWLEKRLPHYMLPSRTVILENFPFTSSGKIDYKRLETFKDNSPLNAGSDTRETPGSIALASADFHGTNELVLRKIWEKVLGSNIFGPEDNFFNVGGSSLTAIHLVTRIEKTMNIALPVIAIFKVPTIRGLAKLLDEKKEEMRASALTTISARGGKTPVFFLAGTTEDTRTYKTIDLCDHPLYMITTFAHKSHNHRIIPIDVWEMAQRTIREIRQAAPSGPYIIIGFCRYAIVAHEIACQLINTGNAVEQLVLIDEFWRKKGTAQFLGHHIKGMFRFGPVHILKKIIPKIKEKLHNGFLALDEYLEKFYRAANRPMPELLQYRLMERAFWKAYAGYMPMPFKGNAIVFDSTNWQEKFAPQLREYVQGTIRRIETKTTHSQWFQPEQAQAIIRKLSNQ